MERPGLYALQSAAARLSWATRRDDGDAGIADTCTFDVRSRVAGRSAGEAWTQLGDASAGEWGGAAVERCYGDLNRYDYCCGILRFFVRLSKVFHFVHIGDDTDP